MYMQSKKIVCLANSRKYKGRCIAGKEISSGRWIRPVSEDEFGALHTEHLVLKNGHVPSILDVIKVPLKEEKREVYHPENKLISDERWKKYGVFQFEDLEKIKDEPRSLWTNENPYEDRISLDYIKDHYGQINYSLFLIKPEDFKIKVKETDNGDMKVRSIFKYKDVVYNLSLTDPVLEYIYEKKGKGEFPIEDDVFLCISLGLPYEGCCYKLVASVISKKYQGKRRKYQKNWALKNDEKIKLEDVNGESKLTLIEGSNKSVEKEKPDQKEKKGLDKLTKKYKKKKNKIKQKKREMEKETKALRKKIDELNKKKEKTEKPYNEKISEYESDLEKIEDRILDFHSGEKTEISTEYADVSFKISRRLEIKNKEKAMNILKKYDMLEEGVKIYKKPLKDLKKRGKVGDDIAYYDKRKTVLIKESVDLDEDEEDLFEELRYLRNEIAREKGIEPYMIFSNRTLRLFAKNKPKDEEQIKKIKGVGSTKFDRYGAKFIKLIKDLFPMNEKNQDEEKPMNEDEKKLYEKMRKLRNDIAKQKGFPAYTVFHDSTLELLAKNKPRDEDKMKEIKGVEEKNFDNYGDKFIELIKKHEAE